MLKKNVLFLHIFFFSKGAEILLAVNTEMSHSRSHCIC